MNNAVGRGQFNIIFYHRWNRFFLSHHRLLFSVSQTTQLTQIKDNISIFTVATANLVYNVNSAENFLPPRKCMKVIAPSVSYKEKVSSIICPSLTMVSAVPSQTVPSVKVLFDVGHTFNDYQIALLVRQEIHHAQRQARKIVGSTTLATNNSSVIFVIMTFVESVFNVVSWA